MTRTPVAVDAPEADVAVGKQLYAQYCSVCHGVGVISGGLTPDLRYSNEGKREHFSAIVLDGILRPLGMPAFSDSLSAQEVEKIKLYVLSREYESHVAEQGAAKAP